MESEFIPAVSSEQKRKNVKEEEPSVDQEDIGVVIQKYPPPLELIGHEGVSIGLSPNAVRAEEMHPEEADVYRLEK